MNWIEQNNQVTPKIEILCASCDQDEAHLATNWCENCLAHFCDSCDSKEHSGRVTRTHQRLTLKEKAKKPTFARCVKHHQDKKFYCKDDNEFLCDVCVIDDHKPHNTISVFKYADETREELRKCLAPLQTAKLDHKFNALKVSKQQCNLEVQELYDRIRSLEAKMTNIDQEMKDLEAAQEKVQTSHVVIQKSIEELGVADLVDQSKLDQMKAKISDIVAQFVPNPFVVSFSKELAHPDIVLDGPYTIRGGTDDRYNSALLSACITEGVYEWKATVIGTTGHWHCAGIATKPACIATGFTTDYAHSLGFGGSGNQMYNMNGTHQAPKPNSSFVFSLDMERKVFTITGEGTQLAGILPPKTEFHPYFLVFKKTNGWRLDCFDRIR